MSNFQVSSHVSHCRIDDGIVVLNMRTEKYVALPPECRPAFELVVEGFNAPAHDIDPSIAQGLRHLIEAGLVTETASQSHASRPVSLTFSDSSMSRMSDIRRPPISPRDVIVFLISLITAAYQLRSQPFEVVINGVRQQRRRFSIDDALPDAERVRELFRIFRWQRLWTYTATDACLFDSLVLITFLRHHGIAATLALGVQTKPFGAHAWAQWGGLVLNDTVEHVSRYTPILVV